MSEDAGPAGHDIANEERLPAPLSPTKQSALDDLPCGFLTRIAKWEAAE